MMNSIKMNRTELLEIVQNNRIKHVKEYDEAVQDYLEAVVVIAKNNLKKAKTGDRAKFKFESFPTAPKSYENDYDKAIRMIELSVDDVIEVEEHTFSQLVLDEWTWKQSFSVSNAAYKRYVN